jgi:uncharacterized flavoprotein (TIGR03862 family)
VPWLAARGVPVAPLLAANCGFDAAGREGAGWSEHFVSRFAGQPFKSVALRCRDSEGHEFHRKGEFVATATGVEGSLIYAASALLRDEITRTGRATFWLDLLPDKPVDKVRAEVQHPRGTRSLTSHLKSRLGLDGIKMALLHELLPKAALQQPEALAATIKALPVDLVAIRPIDEAISSAGGVSFEALDAHLMLKALPGVFCAGEMLDWEAPTGGYLLTACFASGVRAGHGVLAWMGKQATAPLGSTMDATDRNGLAVAEEDGLSGKLAAPEVQGHDLCQPVSAVAPRKVTHSSEALEGGRPCQNVSY